MAETTSDSSKVQDIGTGTAVWPKGTSVSIGSNQRDDFERLNKKLMELKREACIVKAERDLMIRAMLHSFDAGRESK